MPMRVIPVLDVRDGRAVHAVGGDRAHYQPLVSVLHPTADPVGLAVAFREHLGLEQLYLADLDAIAGSGPNFAVYAGLAEAGLSAWVDAGVRDAASLPPLLEAKVASIVVGLETVRGPAALAAILSAVGPERLVFSLDLREGLPVTAAGVDWGGADAASIAEAAVQIGVRRFLLLDLARVGRGRGVDTEPLLRRLVRDRPDLEIAVGGGVATIADVQAASAAGAAAVLVGSALHDGRIGRRDLNALAERP